MSAKGYGFLGRFTDKLVSALWQGNATLDERVLSFLSTVDPRRGVMVLADRVESAELPASEAARLLRVLGAGLPDSNELSAELGGES